MNHYKYTNTYKVSGGPEGPQGTGESKAPLVRQFPLSARNIRMHGPKNEQSIYIFQTKQSSLTLK